MSSPRECPICDTVNSPEAERCNCGYVFLQDDVAIARQQANRWIRRGAVIILSCIVALVITSMLSGKGHTISWMAPRDVVGVLFGIGGLMLTGISTLLYGLRKRLSRRS